MLHCAAALEAFADRLRAIAIYPPGVADALTPAARRVFQHAGIIVRLLFGPKPLVSPYRAQLRKTGTAPLATVQVYRRAIFRVAGYIKDLLARGAVGIDPALDDLQALQWSAGNGSSSRVLAGGHQKGRFAATAGRGQLSSHGHA